MRVRARLLTACATALIAAGAAAQYALDSSLLVGGSRVNPKQATPGMAKPIYTVNYRTGEMQYNRAQAFNDPAYNIYQRYTLDRFDRTGEAAVRRQAGAPRTVVTGAQTSALQPRSTRGSTIGGTPRPHGGLAAPSYRVHSTTKVSGSALKAPRYSAGRVR